MDLKLTSRAEDFIDDKYFHELLQNTKEDLPKIREILAKSKTKQALTLEETATLLAINSPEAKQELFETAKELKRSIYGKRIVLFAPLYIGNYCINNCQYCGFRSSLRKAVRRTLS